MSFIQVPSSTLLSQAAPPFAHLADGACGRLADTLPHVGLAALPLSLLEFRLHRLAWLVVLVLTSTRNDASMPQSVPLCKRSQFRLCDQQNGGALFDGPPWVVPDLSQPFQRYVSHASSASGMITPRTSPHFSTTASPGPAA